MESFEEARKAEQNDRTSKRSFFKSDSFRTAKDNFCAAFGATLGGAAGAAVIGAVVVAVQMMCGNRNISADEK